jgi:Fic family protein
MKEALDRFEKLLHDESLPVLIHTGLAHAQFESIHPFRKTRIAELKAERSTQRTV